MTISKASIFWNLALATLLLGAMCPAVAEEPLQNLFERVTASDNTTATSEAPPESLFRRYPKANSANNVSMDKTTNPNLPRDLEKSAELSSDVSPELPPETNIPPALLNTENATVIAPTFKLPPENSVKVFKEVGDNTVVITVDPETKTPEKVDVLVNQDASNTSEAVTTLEDVTKIEPIPAKESTGSKSTATTATAPILIEPAFEPKMPKPASRVIEPILPAKNPIPSDRESDHLADQPQAEQTETAVLEQEPVPISNPIIPEIADTPTKAPADTAPAIDPPPAELAVPTLAVDYQARSGFLAAPLLDLKQSSKYGDLPAKSSNRRTPLDVYVAKDPNAGISGRVENLNTLQKPILSVIVYDLGLSKKQTAAVINALPPQVTLSFSPYGQNLTAWMNAARYMGYESLLQLPIASNDKNIDSGSLALQANMSPPNIITATQKILATSAGYIGVFAYQGGSLLVQTDTLDTLVGELESRGLGIVEDRSNPLSLLGRYTIIRKTPYLKITHILPDNISSSDVKNQLDTILQNSQSGGRNILAIPPLAGVAKQVTEWLKANGDSVVLVPVSAMLLQPQTSAKQSELN